MQPLAPMTLWSCLLLFLVMQVGLELSQVLRNLGIIADVSVGQQLSRVKGHGRIWDPLHTKLSTSAEAAGYAAMYLTLHLNWDKHKPLYSNAQLAAAPSTSARAGSSEATASAAISQAATSGFTAPMGLNSPTPERVRIISKPSVQRWMGVQQLLAARAAAAPGIFLLSTHQGLLTDIDAEYRGIGGIVLGHLGLPYGHVVQLRGLLRSKYQAELTAAQAAAPAPAQELSCSQSVAQPAGRRLLNVQHIPLAHWDACQVAGQLVSSRLSDPLASNMAAKAYLEQMENQDTSTRLLTNVQDQLHQLELQQYVWVQHQGSKQQRSEGSQASRAADSSSTDRFSGRGGRRAARDGRRDRS
eukprot:GHRR01019129.1.p1 GENE.GHRR01019129.1~~GHRR01019129.1.p1  ORF type:complete len:357 (+),score=155.07 GHRR01019129.1:230-1300(+)